MSMFFVMRPIICHCVCLFDFGFVCRVPFLNNFCLHFISPVLLCVNQIACNLFACCFFFNFILTFLLLLFFSRITFIVPDD